jgi:hypothetical protein
MNAQDKLLLLLDGGVGQGLNCGLELLGFRKYLLQCNIELVDGSPLPIEQLLPHIEVPLPRLRPHLLGGSLLLEHRDP